MNRVRHPLLDLFASATDQELAKYVDYLDEGINILRLRPGQQITRAFGREWFPATRIMRVDPTSGHLRQRAV